MIEITIRTKREHSRMVRFDMLDMLDDDGLPLDEVGAWAKEKHERLRKYVDISRATRRKFIQGTGGASYIDLYCGTGRAVIRDTNEKIDGSPLVAFKCARDGGVPFSQMHIADSTQERCHAAEKRIIKEGGLPATDVGAAEDTVRRIVARLNPYGLHFAFLDPYNLQDLPFSVIEDLSKLKRIDILMHVSAQDLQRNLHSYTRLGDARLDRFMPGWRKSVDVKQSQRAVRAALLAYWASKITALGLPPAQHAELITGTSKNQRLYWLVFVSRYDFAKQLWSKIRSPSGQRDLFGGE
jgi:three-Cys-motif partner protein